MDSELADCLRTWRTRLDPAEAGVPLGGRRRTPGLRREEVAARAGISVNYLVRLEQGHATNPSPSVVSALACVLQLNATEAGHLHRLAGHADGSARVALRQVTPSVRRILDRCADVPVIVVDPAWTIVEANAMAGALLSHDPVGENAARNQFLGPTWVEREPDEDERFEREVVSDLHLRLARHPDDEGVRGIVAELRAASPRFASLWSDPPTTPSSTSRKTFRHPTVGRVTVDCDTLEVVGSDLRVVIWTAAPGSPDASALALLGVVGTEQFTT